MMSISRTTRRGLIICFVLVFVSIQYSIWQSRNVPHIQDGRSPSPEIIVENQYKGAQDINAVPEYSKKHKKKKPNSQGLRKQSQMTSRKALVSNGCGSLTSINAYRKTYQDEYLKHIIVNTKEHIMYCYIPKVANTNFRRVFLALQGVVTKTTFWNVSGYDVYDKYKDNFVYLKSFNKAEQDEMHKTYKKFMFVRNPLERLLSAYRNKFFHPNEERRAEFYEKVRVFYQKYSILGKKRNIRANHKTKPLSFEDFLKYWTDAYDVGECLNEHFVTYNDLCQPCTVNYDFIGKYDSLSTDANYIFENLGIRFQFPGRNDNYSTIATGELVERFYKAVPRPLLKKVRTIFHSDFALFGYPIPGWLG